MTSVLAAPLLVRQDQAMDLRFRPPVGTTASYVLVNSMVQTVLGLEEPIVSKSTTPMTLRVVSRQNGLTTVESRAGKTKLTLPPGSPLAAMRAKIEGASEVVTTVVTDEQGKIVRTTFDPVGPQAALTRQLGAGLMDGLQGMSFRGEPMKIGDEYTIEFDLGRMLTTALGALKLKGEGKIPIVVRLVGVTVESGTTFARLTMSAKGKSTVSDGKTTMSLSTAFRGEATVDAATELARATSTTGDNDITAQGQTMHQHMEITLRAV